MSRRWASQSCGIILPNGRDCPQPVPPDAELNLCAQHLRFAAEAYQPPAEPHFGKCLSCGSDLPVIDDNRDPVVYYLLFASRVKIGTTVDLQRRLSVVPHDRLLAVEPGGYPLERDRHRTFAEYRIPGQREWYTPGPRLVDHVHGLRGHAQPSTPGRN